MSESGNRQGGSAERVWDWLVNKIEGRKKPEGGRSPEDKTRTAVRAFLMEKHTEYVHQQLGGDEWEKNDMDAKIRITPEMVKWLVEHGMPDREYEAPTGSVSAKDVAIRTARDLYFGGSESGLAYKIPNRPAEKYIGGLDKAAVIKAIEQVLPKDTLEGRVFRMAQEFHEVYFGPVTGLQYLQADLRKVDKVWYFSDVNHSDEWAEVLAEERAEAGFIKKVEDLEESGLSLVEAMKAVKERGLATALKYTWFAPERNVWGQIEPYRLLEDRFFDVFMKKSGVRMMFSPDTKLADVKKKIGVARGYDGLKLGEIAVAARAKLVKEGWGGEKLEQEVARQVEVTGEIRAAVGRAIEFRGGIGNEKQAPMADEVRVKEVYRCNSDNEYVLETSAWTRQLVAMLRAAATIPRVYRDGLAKAILPEGRAIIFEAKRKGPWSGREPWVKPNVEIWEGENDARLLDFKEGDETEDLQDKLLYLQGMADEAGVSLEELVRDRRVSREGATAVVEQIVDEVRRKKAEETGKAANQILDIDIVAEVARVMEEQKERISQPEIELLRNAPKAEGTRSRRARWNKYYDILQAPTWLEARRLENSLTFADFVENQLRKGQGHRSEMMYQARLLSMTALVDYKVGEGDRGVWDEDFGFALNAMRRQPAKMEALLTHDLVFPRQVENQYNENLWGFLLAEMGAYRKEALLEANYGAGKAPYAAQRAAEVAMHTASTPEMVNRFAEFIKRRWILTKEIEHPLLQKILIRGAEGMSELNRLEKKGRLGGVVEEKRLATCGIALPGWDQIRDAPTEGKAVFWLMHLDKAGLYYLFHDYGAFPKEGPFSHWGPEEIFEAVYYVATYLPEEIEAKEGVMIKPRDILRQWQANVDARRGEDRARRMTDGMSREERKWLLGWEHKVRLEAVDRVQRYAARALRDELGRWLARDNRLKVKLKPIEQFVLDPTLPGTKDFLGKEKRGGRISHEVYKMELLKRVVEILGTGRVKIDGRLVTKDDEDVKVLDPNAERIPGMRFKERVRRRDELLAALVDNKRVSMVVGYDQNDKPIEKAGLAVFTRYDEAGAKDLPRVRWLDERELAILHPTLKGGLQRQVSGETEAIERFFLRRLEKTSGLNDREKRWLGSMMALAEPVLRGEQVRMPLPETIKPGDPLYNDYELMRFIFEFPRGGAAQYHKWFPFVGLENPSDFMATADWTVKSRVKVYGVRFEGDAAKELERRVKDPDTIEKLEDGARVFYPADSFEPMNYMKMRLHLFTGIGKGLEGRFKPIEKDRLKVMQERLGMVEELLGEQVDGVMIPNTPGMLPQIVCQFGDEFDPEEREYIPTFEHRLIIDASDDNAHYGSVAMHIAFGDMSYDDEWLQSKRWDAPDTLAGVYDRFTYGAAQAIRHDPERIKIRFADEPREEVAARIPTIFELGARLGEEGLPSIGEVLVANFLKVGKHDFSFGVLPKIAKRFFRNFLPKVGAPIQSYYKTLEANGWDHVEVVALAHLEGVTPERARDYRGQMWWEGVLEKTAKGFGTEKMSETTIKALEPLLQASGLGRLASWAGQMIYGQTVRSGLVFGGIGLWKGAAVGTLLGVPGAVVGGFIGALAGFGSGVLIWHGPRALFGQYKTYFSSGWPVLLREPIHDSFVDVAEDAKQTLEGAAKRNF